MKCFAALIGWLALLAAPAQANYFDGQPVTDPRVLAMLDAGSAYWDRLGTPATCAPTLEQTNLSPFGVLAGVPEQSCEIGIDTEHLTEQLVDMRDRDYGRFYRRWTAAKLCGLIAHEVGHTRGLFHSDGLMAERLPQRWESQPWECRRLARKIIPRRPTNRRS